MAAGSLLIGRRAFNVFRTHEGAVAFQKPQQYETYAKLDPETRQMARFLTLWKHAWISSWSARHLLSKITAVPISYSGSRPNDLSPAGA